MESKLWEKFAKDYEDKVFSLTSIPQRRKQILESIKPGKILNLGCGPTYYLNQELTEQSNQVVAVDFCQNMLYVAKMKFTHPNLEYKLADARDLPFKNNTFDSIISVNSILPQKRDQTYEMISEIHRTLKKNGKLMAFLASFNSVEKVIKNLKIDFKIDVEQMRVYDTDGWQCFHTPETIKEMMEIKKFSKYNYKKVFLKTRQEISELKRLYGFDTSKSLIYEYLLTATK